MIYSPAPVCLSLKGVSKDYAVRVLNHIDFELREGEIHALLGANGAGKSTLCKIIAGLTPATTGEMSCNDTPYSPADKQQAEAHGIQIVQQELNLISTLSIAENLFLTQLPRRLGIINRKKLHSLSREVLVRFGMDDLDVELETGSLGIGQQQMIEIASSLNRQCKVLILDEPTAALSGKESEQLFSWLIELREQGAGIIYVSHRLDEIKRIADRTTVLRDGCKVGTFAVDDISTDKMVSLMTGEEREVKADREKKSTSEKNDEQHDKSVLRVESLTCKPLVKNVSFSVQAGECFGIAGLVGSGRTELLRAIFGADRAENGELFLENNSGPFRFKHPHDAVRYGIAMVTEDRKKTGLLLSQSIRINSSLCNLNAYTNTAGVINQTKERSETTRMQQDLDLRCHNIEQSVETLSGGNQQKVVVSKWLLRGADVYLFDEPTRGIDVAARERIHRIFNTLTDQGKGIVIVSSDLDELFETCDRIGVMSAGEMAAIYTRKEWSTDLIMQAAFSGYMDQSERQS